MLLSNVATDGVIGLVLVAISLFLYFFLIPHYVVEGNSFGMSPRFFPQLGTVIVGATGLIMVIVSTIIIVYTKTSFVAALKSIFQPINYKGPLSVVVALSLLGLSFEYLGFIFSIPASLFLLMLLFGQRSPVKLVLVSLIVPTVLFLLFNYGLNMPLE